VAFHPVIIRWECNIDDRERECNHEWRQAKVPSSECEWKPQSQFPSITRHKFTFLHSSFDASHISSPFHLPIRSIMLLREVTRARSIKNMQIIILSPLPDCLAGWMDSDEHFEKGNFHLLNNDVNPLLESSPSSPAQMSNFSWINYSSTLSPGYLYPHTHTHTHISSGHAA
jgi:hypothetical protein